MGLHAANRIRFFYESHMVKIGRCVSFSILWIDFFFGLWLIFHTSTATMIHSIKFNHMVTSFFFSKTWYDHRQSRKYVDASCFEIEVFFLTPPHSKFVGNKHTTTNTCNSFASSNILHSSTDGGMFIIWIFFSVFFCCWKK